MHKVEQAATIQAIVNSDFPVEIVSLMMHRMRPVRSNYKTAKAFLAAEDKWFRTAGQIGVAYSKLNPHFNAQEFIAGCCP